MKTHFKALARFRKALLPVFGLSLLLIGASAVVRLDLMDLVRGLPRGLALLRHMVPPEWSAMPRMVGPAIETVQIAFVGTGFGIVLAFVFSLLAASNVNANRALRELARGIMSAERALPDLIVMLLFVAIVGLGPFPAVMALSVSAIGMLGKLFADAFEEVDPRSLEALAAVGASKMQVIQYALIPQVMPSLIANSLFRFEVNIRLSIFLGVVGAGGIGSELIMATRLLNYRTALSAIIVILVLVMVCERISDALKKAVIGHEVLQ
ncbi:MAG: Phosphate-import permease protein PhnE [Firmicutes bacterium]|nr:Phosphate-import permease protein PhnE [Bacillota bacterium]